VRSSLRALLVVGTLVASALVVVGAPEKAFACSCAAPGDLGALERSDVAFIGTAVLQTTAELETQYPHAVDDQGRPDPIANRTLRFVIERVFKGNVTSVQDIATHGQGPACGLGVEPGATYLVFGSASSEGLGRPKRPNEYAAHLCNGTRQANLGEQPDGYPNARKPTSTRTVAERRFTASDPTPCRTVRVADMERIYQVPLKETRAEFECVWSADQFSVSYYPLNQIRGMGKELFEAREAEARAPTQVSRLGDDAFFTSDYGVAAINVRRGDFIFIVTASAKLQPDTGQPYDLPDGQRANLVTVARLVLRS
jgi:hypothetical protein